MADQFILAIDQGTTGSTVLVVDVSNPQDAKVIGRSTVDFQQHYPKTGWVEHDLGQIWQSVDEAAKAAISGASKANNQFDPQKIAAIGITNQRETLCVFDRKTSQPARKAIVWQCKRSRDICDELKQAGHEQLFKDKTGLVVDPYFSGTKLTWLVRNEPEIAKGLSDGRLAVGTIDTYLIHRLTAGESHVTEASNASRTLLYDIHAGDWAQDLCEILEIPNRDCLPEVRDSSGEFGRTKGLGFLPDGIPITGVLGDQQAALAGQTCFGVGEAKCTYGTGAFLLLNLGEQALKSNAGMLTTVAWQLGGKRTYAFEGAAFIAGAAIQFLRDQFGMIANAGDSQKLAEGAKAAPEVYFVPALAGLGAPHWDARAEGAFLGLTRGTTKEQMIRAALEGIAFEVTDLIGAMQQDFKEPMKVLRVDGGAAANDLLMQTQADLCALPVDRPVNLETTAFGAALFAGLGVGIYDGTAAMAGARSTAREFQPNTDVAAKEKTAAMQAGWQRAVHAVQVFAGTRA